MKKRYLIFAGLLALQVACEPVDQQVATATCQETAPVNQTYSKGAAILQLLDTYIRKGLPGIAVAVYTPAQGYWTGASGYANLERKTKMQGCHLQFGQSVAKLYTATTIMQLVDDGKLVLDSPVSQYLPEHVTKKLTSPEKVTVRMLLNHTSGVPDYTENTAYVASVLQHPLKQYTTDDLLNYLAGMQPTGTPGAYVRYSNSNYLLLALLADQVGANHVRLMQDRILAPLGLRQTFYHNSATYLEQPTLVDSYFDRFGDEKLENITQMQRVNVASMYGDDGIIAAPTDYLTFLRGLLEGKLVTANSLKAMTTWYNDKDGKQAYGLGLEKTTVAGQEAYGHGGAGIGAGCALYYFPETKTYLFVGINLGVLTDGPYVRMADALTKELVALL